MKNFYNPFTDCTARDISFEEVEEYWCPPYNAFPKVDEEALHSNLTPIIIEGPRGSGKTMLLKHLSYFCQKYNLKDNESLVSYFSRSGDLAIYFRYKDNFGNLFESLSCSDNDKSDLFIYYFELFIAQELIRIIYDLYNDGCLNNNQVNKFSYEFAKIIAFEPCPFEALNDAIDSKIYQVDEWVRKSRYIDNSEDIIRRIITGKNLIKKVCKLIRKTIPAWNNILFVIIIDEYENAAKYQKELNTLLKQVDEKERITFRVGVRPNGISTNATNIGDEFLQNNRDYLLYSFSIPTGTSQMSKYKNFLREVANKRLKKVPLLDEYGMTNIESLLGSKEDLEAEGRSIVKNRKNHFYSILGNKISNIEFNNIYSALKNDDNPLLEMLNLLWLQRGISINDINKAMNSFLNNNYDNPSELSYKYHMDYVNKYKYSLLFMLINIYGAKKQYYSFNTFAYLSTGAINDFISLCRNTFYQFDEQYISKIKEIKQPYIDIKYQTQGAYDTSVEQLNKINLCNDNGNKMYCFIMNLGNMFREYHKDLEAKYPETNQFAFSDIISIQTVPASYSILTSLLKWGAILKKSRIQSISIGKRKGEIFIINKIFAPLFNISYRTRGGYNPILTSGKFIEMSYKPLEPAEIKEIMKTNYSPSESDSTQLSLFKW